MSNTDNTRGINLDEQDDLTPDNIKVNHVLIIGIDQYSNGILPLENAVRDAKTFKEVLVSNFQFEEKNIKILLNKDASLEKILDTFQEYIEKLTPNDNLILYFSGHGIYNKSVKRGYWIPSDARLDFRGSYLNNSEVIDFLQYCKAHHIFCIVDSCFSEALFTNTRGVGDNFTRRFESKKSRWVLSAGRLELVSDGSLGGNSPFTESLVYHLKTETKPYLLVGDLCRQVITTVAFNAEQTPIGAPIPKVGDMGGEFIFRKKGFIENVDEKTERTDSNPSRGTGASAPSETKPHNVPNIEPQPEPAVVQPATFSDWSDQMKELIALDMSKAMVSLNGGFNRSSSKYNDLVLLRARLNSAKMDAKRGVVTSSQTNMIHNQIRYALIELIDDLKETDLKRLWIQRD